MKAWRINELGAPWDRLAIEDIDLPAPGKGICQVQVLAADLNFADILQCQGEYQVKLTPPFTPGMNAVGRVLACGEGVPLSEGQMVIGPTYRGSGGYAEQALMPFGGVRVIPADVDPGQAAAMHVTYGTAWFGLHLRGRLAPGESVLVLAAAGGVGAAAVELARRHGCMVIAAAGGEAKLEACRALGADHVIDYNSEDLYERVMSLTDKRGVDVVYDPVGGDYFDVARRLVAWEGRYLVIGFASGRIPELRINHTLVKNYDIVGVHMGGYRGRDESAFDRCYEALYGMLREGEINPLIDATIGFSELPDYLRMLADRKTKGRVIFDPSR